MNIISHIRDILVPTIFVMKIEFHSLLHMYVI